MYIAPNSVAGNLLRQHASPLQALAAAESELVRLAEANSENIVAQYEAVRQLRALVADEKEGC